jgi:hypothetical protein
LSSTARRTEGGGERERERENDWSMLSGLVEKRSSGDRTGVSYLDNVETRRGREGGGGELNTIKILSESEGIEPHRLKKMRRSLQE